MACDPNTLLAQAKCFNCNISGAMFDAVEIVLLCAINDGGTVACDPQTLISQASCLFTCIPPGMMPAVKLSLLCQILTGGGIGGGNLSGVGSPEGVQTADAGVLYVDTSTTPPSLWVKASGSGNTGWTPLIQGE
jgi:hypothetical protein